MGVLCQSLLAKTAASNPPFPSARMAKLFYEFLSRYNEWRMAKLQKLIGIIVVVSLGLFALFIPWLIPKSGIIISFMVLIPFYFSTKHYFRVIERAEHIYINVHVLHHHLIGKLEVGFCDHKGLCHCVEDFRDYVFDNYGICLDNRSLK